jgi:hypothetical protein
MHENELKVDGKTLSYVKRVSLKVALYILDRALELSTERSLLSSRICRFDLVGAQMSIAILLGQALVRSDNYLPNFHLHVTS